MNFLQQQIWNNEFAGCIANLFISYSHSFSPSPSFEREVGMGLYGSCRRISIKISEVSLT